MKNLLLLLFFICAAVNAQEVIQQDVLKLGKSASASDKSVTFDTADGVSNPKLSVEKVSKKLKYDQNTFQLGGASASDNKDFIFNGDNKKIRYDGTANELQYDGDLLSVGDGTNTDKSFKFNKGASSPSIRYNSTTGKLEFSNDNASFKAIGSGSGAGSGINILLNASFEDPLTDGWNNSGGTFSQQTYTNPTESNTKFARFVASGSGQYVETDLTVVPDFLGAGCQAQFEKYATVTDGAWKIVVLDASSNVLATQNFNQSGGASTFISTPLLSFPCPLAAATFKLRIESLAAATIDFDLAYGGGNKNTVDIAQSRFAGSAYYAGTTNCQWQVTSAVYSDYATDADCPAPTIVSSSLGQWSTTDANLPQFTINNLPAGRYVGHARMTITPGSTGATACSRLTDGTTNGQAACSYTSGAVVASTHTVSIDVTYATAGTRTFKIQGRVNVADINIINTGVNGDGVEFFLAYYPSDSQTAVTSEQSGWFIDANIGGANPSLGTANVASYTEITNASLDMVLNAGSASALIPCSSTNASTGLTCSVGNEGVGVVFNPPYAGYFDVCSYFSSDLSVSTSGTAESIFQNVLTSNASQTILQEGKVRASNRATGGTGGVATTIPNTNCSTFYLSDTSQKTIRLMYEQSVAAPVNSSIILGDRAAASGQRDIRVTVKPSTTNISRPVLTGDQVTSPGASRLISFSASFSNTSSDGGVCTSSPCGMWNTKGGVFTGAIRNSVGNYTVSLSGISGTPSCGLLIRNFTSTTITGCYSSTKTPTTMSVLCVAGATGNDAGFELTCTAEK